MKRKPKYKIVTKLVELPVSDNDIWSGTIRHYKIINQK